MFHRFLFGDGNVGNWSISDGLLDIKNRNLNLLIWWKLPVWLQKNRELSNDPW